MPEAPTFWQSYRQGLAVGLGLLTVYLLVVILLGAFVVRPALENLGQAGQSGPGGAACSTSWV
ncbi:hypothetical protein [Thermus phage P23-77]|uniref:Uncharacterized protein n=1 Tax=Thermus virus P23-77 TaxID=1714272 RepID=C8CHM4_9VIRU|nr:hypothetical protein P23-77_gp28 [Thermus phage P23-77]ACV05053.1 hypothetical protein [Thermus phage P23-77]